jgi:hypothetical protein
MAPLNLYVRPDGNNANDGLADTPARAFLTVQKAVDYVSESVMLGPYNVYIHVGVGTFGRLVLRPYEESGGTVTIIGAGTASTILTGTNAVVVASEVPNRYIFSSLTIRCVTNASADGSPTAISTGQYGWITCVNCVLEHNEQVSGVGTRCVVRCGYHSLVTLSGCAFNVNGVSSGSTLLGFLVNDKGVLTITSEISVTGRGATFAVVERHGLFRNVGGSFTGSFEGKRYSIKVLAVAETHGGGENFFPGTVAGVKDATSYYG